mgnify:CR=1 FL=1
MTAPCRGSTAASTEGQLRQLRAVLGAGLLGGIATASVIALPAPPDCPTLPRRHPPPLTLPLTPS